MNQITQEQWKNLHESMNANALGILYKELPNGKLEGREYKAGNIRGDAGESFCYNIDNHRFNDWSDHAVKGAGMFQLIKLIRGYSDKEHHKIYEEFTTDMPTPVKQPVSTELNKPRLTPTYLDGSIKITRDLLEKKGPAKKVNGQWKKTHKLVSAWPYHNSKGKVVYYIARYDHLTEKKESGKAKKAFRPVCMAKETGELLLKAMPFEERFLFNLHNIEANKNKFIIVVEGEKAAQRIKELNTDFIPTTIQGGVKAFDKISLDALTGRSIILWPDKDEEGIEAMVNLSQELLRRHNPKHLYMMNVRNCEELGDKEDAYDIIENGILTTENFSQWIKANVTKMNTGPIEPEPEPRKPDVEIVPKAETSADRHVKMDIMNGRIEAIQNAGDKLMALGLSLFYAPQDRRILPDLEIWHDEFYQRDMIRFVNTAGVEIVDQYNTDYNAVISMRLRTSGNAVKKSELDELIRGYITEKVNKKDSVADWLNTLKWDGEKRVDNFMVEYMGAKECQWSVEVSRIFWLSMVALWRSSNTKCDTIVVLEGAQGNGKTQALEIIGGYEHYTSLGSTSFTDTKRLVELTAGKLVAEIGELSSKSKKENDALKDFVTRRTSTERISYAKAAREYHRRYALVATTNDTEYLTDSTGERRFIPIKVGTIDLVALKQDREQLIAEALHRVNNGEDWWSFDLNLHDRQTAQRKSLSIHHEDIVDWLAGYTDEYGREYPAKEFIKVKDVMSFINSERNQSGSRHDLSRSEAVASLRAAGFNQKVKKVNGVPQRGWRAPSGWPAEYLSQA